MYTHSWLYILIRLYIYSFISIYTHLYPVISIYTHLYSFISIYTHLYWFISIYTHLYSEISIHTHVSSFISIYTHSSLYILIHLYIYSFISIYPHSSLYILIHLYGSVLPGFLPSFPSQIWVSDVTFDTFFGDKKCDASHFSHFWEECDALAHENMFLTCDVFCHILPGKRHILAPPVQNFFEREEMWRFGWDWNMLFSFRLRFVTYLGSVKREGHLG